MLETQKRMHVYQESRRKRQPLYPMRKHLVKRRVFGISTGKSSIAIG